MDDNNNRNLILATVLSFLVVVVWYTLFAPPPPAEQAAEPAAVVATDGVQVPAGTTAAPGATATGATPGTVPATTGSADPTATAARVAIETPSLEGSISLAGGRVDDLALKGYRETLDANSPLVRLLSPTAPASVEGMPSVPGMLAVAPTKPYYAIYGWAVPQGGDPALVPGPLTIWQVESGEVLAPGQPVTLVWDNGAGQIFRRVFSIDDRFLFTVTQSIQNNAETAFTAQPYGVIARHGRPDTEDFFILHEGAVGMTDGKLLEEKYRAISRLDPVAGYGNAQVMDVRESGWIGFTDKYWMTTLAPEAGQPFTSVVKYVPGADIYQTEAILPLMTVQPGAEAASTTRLFAGAKVWEDIRNYERNDGITRFVDSIDWGWLFFLTKPIFRLLHWLHDLIGNMGWAIIALTFVLKLLVFPLARKSYISMAKMRELQPEMEAIKARTGDDRMKFQQEVMALYKKEKVNPAAGCLPILLQIPIFFALYKVIFVTIELRHAPWFGWIRDLSAPDPSSLLNLFGLLPFAAPAQGTMLHSLSLPILAILLGVSMWLQQKLNPAPTDATQKMIFAWMPWIFMFMLGGFASGLVLYWITNNVITIGQQYTIMSMHGHRPNLFGNVRESFRRTKK
ncbi:MAG: membrane protein insertase YidC [Paracoccus sp. (in: a-proteobacteria)]|uniref:membrane protein insertase YidC n=1 Tax=Paracoccus sp. TaxID=267 RepID=UPI0026E07516|nr:membrane protein insertase YidC [Paracoccus sp. (in: a-proteobacteria)]MDO5613670.1 membrane protein insertase YidC [Paracoccus sp. (in: a-proteobacteria)]